jgi:hypothetical protein
VVHFGGSDEQVGGVSSPAGLSTFGEARATGRLAQAALHVLNEQPGRVSDDQSRDRSHEPPLMFSGDTAEPVPLPVSLDPVRPTVGRPVPCICESGERTLWCSLSATGGRDDQRSCGSDG